MTVQQEQEAQAHLEAAPQKVGPLAALGHRDFALFFVALVGAGLGTHVRATANIWQIYELTNSPLHLGLTGLAHGLTIVTLSLTGGVIADRVDRRLVLMASQAVNTAVVLALAGLTALELIEVWHIYLAIVASAAFHALDSPTRNALAPALVPKTHLLNALALNQTARHLSDFAGPAMAGVLISAVGLPATYVVNTGLHLIALATLPAVRAGPVLAAKGQSALSSFLEGLRFVREKSIILVLLGMDAAARLFGGYRTLLPIFATAFGLGSEGFGFLLSAPAAGALFGAFVIIWLGDVRYKGLWVVAGTLGYCLCLVLLAASPWFLLALLATFLLGAFDSVQATPRSALIQLLTPNELRGRVSSFQSMVTGSAPYLGQAQSGALAAVIGAPGALVAGAIGGTAVLLWLAITRKDLRAADL